MADIKISQLPAATTPLAGTEEVPLVQSGTTKKVTVTNLRGTAAVTAVTATAPVVSSGGLTPVISMAAATTSVNGYLTSADWNTFNGKGSGTVTGVTGSGNIASSGGAAPNITFTGLLPVASGGTATATPSIVAGTNVTVTGTWPNQTINSTGSGTGDVVGPASATDNAITRFDLATGKLIQNSLVTVADDGAITAPQVGSIIPFYFANQAAFPSAATYHGALAHSHADGAMFFAHGSVWNRLLDESTDVTVAQGGTSLSTLTANNVILGNGTSAPLFVAPSTNGNVLTSTGSTWASSAPAAGGIVYTAVKVANYTAVNNDGVLTNTTGGAFTVTLPTSPSVGNIIIIVDSFSQWGTNNLTIDPTALIKIANNTAGDTLVCDITGITVTLVYTGAAYGWNVSAQIGGNSGTVVTLTGTQTLTNKTIAFGSNTLSDVASLSTVQTFTGTKTFSGTSATLAMILNDTAEVATVSATAATGTIDYYITTQSVLYYTTSASANWTVNFRASSGTLLDTAMFTNQSVTAAFLVTQGSTAYYNSAVTIDGNSVTPKYQGGTAYAAGNASAVDVYMYTIVKTGPAAFTVFTSQTKFA